MSIHTHVEAFFKNKRVVIATMHKKENIIRPLLKKMLGVDAYVPEHFNTDVFGTFTREVKRTGDQLEAAKAKARAALKITGADIAIASEGSFSAHPLFPQVTSNLEVVVLLDPKNAIEIVGHAQTTHTNFDQAYVSSLEEVVSFAKRIGFPEHGIIVRKSETSKKIYKDIQTWEELESLSKKLLKGFFTKRIFLEADMRAHRNPTRMTCIEQAALDMIESVIRTCPQCARIGFSKKKYIKGLNCSSCGLSTDVPGIFLYECEGCLTQEERKEGDVAPPEMCSFCNP